MKLILSAWLLLSFFIASPQERKAEVEILTSGTRTSLRGLSVVNDNIVWVSGSHGTVGKSTDAGKTWKWFVVKGFDSSDFRDIEAFDATTAVIMAVASPAYILKTSDGGETWKVVYENKDSKMFLDAMEFWDEESGIVVGDPINGRFFLTRYDPGNGWKDVSFDRRPRADTGEACFAASGTNIRALSRGEVLFVSGGKKSRVFTKNKAIGLPLIQGQETTGANSIAVFKNEKRKASKTMIVVGGNFNKPASTEKNCAYSTDGGKTWHLPQTPPHGYRSCVEYITKKQLVSCGLNGVDLSNDGGKNFQQISNDGFHVCRQAKEGKTIYFAGGNGRVGKLVWK